MRILYIAIFTIALVVTSSRVHAKDGEGKLFEAIQFGSTSADIAARIEDALVGSHPSILDKISLIGGAIEHFKTIVDVANNNMEPRIAQAKIIGSTLAGYAGEIAASPLVKTACNSRNTGTNGGKVACIIASTAVGISIYKATEKTGKFIEEYGKHTSKTEKAEIKSVWRRKYMTSGVDSFVSTTPLGPEDTKCHIVITSDDNAVLLNELSGVDNINATTCGPKSSTWIDNDSVLITRSCTYEIPAHSAYGIYSAARRYSIFFEYTMTRIDMNTVKRKTRDKSNDNPSISFSETLFERCE
jgi:hypothetical protein